MARRDSEKFAILVEVRTHGALHGRLTTRDGKTKANGKVADDVLQRVSVHERTEQFWPITGQAFGQGLAEGDVYILYFESVKEGTNTLVNSCARAPVMVSGRTPIQIVGLV